MKKALKALFVLLFLILAVSGALAAEKKNKPEIKILDNYVAVFDFEVTTGDKGISRPLADKVIHVFSESDKYEVIDRGNMNKILKEQKFQMTGCVAQECKVEAGQILGVGKIVSGSVGIVGKTYYLTLQVIDVKTGKVELSAEDECRCEIDELLGSTRRLAKKLLGEQVEQPLSTALKPIESKAEQAARAKAELEAKSRAEAEAKAKAEETEKEKAAQMAIAKAEAKAKAEEVERAKAAQLAKARAEAEEAARAKAKAEEIERAKAEQAARAKAEVEARARAEESEKLKAAQIARVKAEAEARAKGEEAERIKAEQLARSRAEEIERLKAEIAKTRAEAETKAKYEEAERIKAGQIAKADTQKQFKTATSAVDQAAGSAKISDSGPRFERLSSGVVRDTQSGLDWYAGPDKNTGWDDAKTWVANLNVDEGGWRMPTINELNGLYRISAGSRNTTPLLETTGWLVWSGESGPYPWGAWALDFDDGREILERRENSINKRTLAVRSTPKAATAAIDPALIGTKIIASDGRYEKFASGVVRDTKSSLEWYAGPDKNTGWVDAKQWIGGLRVDGGAWRLPTITELKLLCQKGSGSRNMTPLLETTGWRMWSGETNGPGGVWTLDFGDCRELIDGRDNSIYKRGVAVRSRR